MLKTLTSINRDRSRLEASMGFNVQQVYVNGESLSLLPEPWEDNGNDSFVSTNPFHRFTAFLTVGF